MSELKHNKIMLIATCNGRKFVTQIEVDLAWLPVSPDTNFDCELPDRIDDIMICTDKAIMRHSIPPSIDVTKEAEECLN